MANKNVMPRRLPLRLLEKMTNHFSADRVLGSGAYGKVYLGIHKDGRKIAVKILYDQPGHGDVQFDKEFENLTSLQHENIVRLVGYCHETLRECVAYNGRMVLADVTKRALCFEFMESGSLDKYLSDESSGHNWRVRYATIKGICNGLKYLHEELKPPIYHLDLKPANILLDENMIPKIADFGLSRFFGEERSHITTSSVGTLGYLPPEYITQNIISNKLDIFSFGVVIIKIIAGPAGHTNSAEMPAKQFIEIVCGNWRNRLQEPSGDFEDPCLEQVKRCIEIALSCLEADRRKRPKIGDIFNMLNETETTYNDQGALMDQVHGNWGNSLPTSSGAAFESYSEHVERSLEVDLSCVACHGTIAPTVLNETATLEYDHGPLIDQMTSCMVKETELINVYPVPLHFHFRPNKCITCPVQITNNMDGHHVAVRFVWKGYGKKFYTNVDYLQGFVPPKSTYTFVATMQTGEQQRLDKMELSGLVLESCLWEVGSWWQKGRYDTSSFFKRCKDENRCRFHELTVRGIRTKTYERMTSEPIRPSVKVVTQQEDEIGFLSMTSMDVHPTDPWVMAGHRGGQVAIWNYETEARLITLVAKREDTRPLVYSVRFVPLMQLLVVGDDLGYIHVYSCMNINICVNFVLVFKAHKECVTSLAVHPTQPLVLSASYDELIKLWDCEKGWTCIRTFVGHSWSVEKVIFSPHDHNIFASASQDSTVKIWSIFSTDPITTLDCHDTDRQPQQYVDYYPISTEGDHHHYMVTGGYHTARIWDLRTEKCVRKFEGLRRVGVINCFSDRPTMFSVSNDNSVSLHDGTTNRIKSTVQFGLSRIHSYAYIKGIRSLAVGHDNGIAIMQID